MQKELSPKQRDALLAALKVRPAGRRSVSYDRAGLESRKEHRFGWRGQFTPDSKAIEFEGFEN